MFEIVQFSDRMDCDDTAVHFPEEPVDWPQLCAGLEHELVKIIGEKKQISEELESNEKLLVKLKEEIRNEKKLNQQLREKLVKELELKEVLIKEFDEERASKEKVTSASRPMEQLVTGLRKLLDSKRESENRLKKELELKLEEIKVVQNVREQLKLKLQCQIDANKEMKEHMEKHNLPRSKSRDDNKQTPNVTQVLNEQTKKTTKRIKKFRKQHVEGKHRKFKPKNTVSAKLPGAKVAMLRKAGTKAPVKGRGDDQGVLFTTLHPLPHQGNGFQDGGQTGCARLVVTAVPAGPRAVAPVHLNGVATTLEDGHVLLGDHIFSQCTQIPGQTQRLNF